MGQHTTSLNSIKREKLRLEEENEKLNKQLLALNLKVQSGEMRIKTMKEQMTKSSYNQPLFKEYGTDKDENNFMNIDDGASEFDMVNDTVMALNSVIDSKEDQLRNVLKKLKTIQGDEESEVSLSKVELESSSK